jgi:hypothetical protein
VTQITDDHVEWAVVGRLRRLLEEPPHQEFNVTQAYALFTTILCWVMQHVRIPEKATTSDNDLSARDLFRTLSGMTIADDPWRVYIKPAERIELVGSRRITIPGPSNFEHHTAGRFLINLRDATAHGDARNVKPFNFPIRSEQLLVGFRFTCAEYRDPKDRKRITWQGTITLLESDMRRIGGALAKYYCDAIRRHEPHHRDSQFGRDAGALKEVAA